MDRIEISHPWESSPSIAYFPLGQVKVFLAAVIILDGLVNSLHWDPPWDGGMERKWN